MEKKSIKIKAGDIPGIIKKLSEALINSEDVIIEGEEIKELHILGPSDLQDFTDTEISDMEDSFECQTLETWVDRYYCKNLCSERFDCQEKT